MPWPPLLAKHMLQSLQCHNLVPDMAWLQWEEAWPWAACETPTQVVHQTSKCTSPSAGRREDIHTPPGNRANTQGICSSNSGAAPALCDGHWAERRSYITACAGYSHTPSRWWWPAHPEEDRAGIHNQIQSSQQRHPHKNTSSWPQ